MVLSNFLFFLIRCVLVLSLEGFEIDGEMGDIGIRLPSSLRKGIALPLDIV